MTNNYHELIGIKGNKYKNELRIAYQILRSAELRHIYIKEGRNGILRRYNWEEMEKAAEWVKRGGPQKKKCKNKGRKTDNRRQHRPKQQEKQE